MLNAGRLSSRMQLLGVSQAELARRIGLSQQAVGKLVNGRSRETPKLERIARELKTSSRFLEGEIDDPDVGADTCPQLTSEEREWLDLFVKLTAEQRKAISALARTMVIDVPLGTLIHDARVSPTAPDHA